LTLVGQHLQVPDYILLINNDDATRKQFRRLLQDTGGIAKRSAAMI
jgi:hypothetical protein